MSFVTGWCALRTASLLAIGVVPVVINNKKILYFYSDYYGMEEAVTRRMVEEISDANIGWCLFFSF